MRALVTGGGGFLGLYIVEQLVERGVDVRVLCRGSYPRLDEIRVDCVTGDIRDAARVAEACRDCDVVFHVAAVAGIWGSWEHYHGINTLGTQNVVAGCRASGVRRLVFTSSPSVVFDAHSHRNADESLPYPSSYLCYYPQTKMLAEQAVLSANGQSGLATVALRPHLIWGPRDTQLIPRLIRRAQAGRLRRIGCGGNQVSMAYVENVAAAHLQVAETLSLDSPTAGQAYFINEPEPVKLWDWINLLLASAGLPPVTRSLPRGAAWLAGATCEAVYGALQIRAEPPITRFLAAQLGSDHWYSIEKARRDFGYRPLVSVEEGLRRLEPELRSLGSPG